MGEQRGCALEPASSPNVEKAPGTAAMSKAKVLIVEDDAIEAMGMRALRTSLPATVADMMWLLKRSSTVRRGRHTTDGERRGTI